MMEQLRRASGGMMNDMFLQQQAMKAMISGIEFDDMIVAMEYVRKYAIATGSDVNQKMETVMTGLARGSAQFMDDVGIQVMGAKDVVGATIDQMKQKMGEFADTSDETASAISQLKTAWVNLKQEVGVGLEPITKRAVEYLTEGVKLMREFYEWDRKSTTMAKAAADGVWSTRKDNMYLLVETQAKYNALLKEEEKTGKKNLNQRQILTENLGKGAGTKARLQGFDFFSSSEWQSALKDFNNARKESLKSAIANSGGGSGSVAPVGGGGGGSKAKSGSGKKEENYSDWLIKYEEQNIDYLGTIWDEAVKLEEDRYQRSRVALQDFIKRDDANDYDSSAIFGMSDSDMQGILPPESNLDKLKSFMDEYGAIVQSGMNTVGDIFSAVYSKQAEDIQYAAQAQIDAVNASSKSEKQKAKEIKKINEQAAREQREIRLKEWRAQILMSIANTALGVTAALPKGGIPLAIATGVIGAINTGIIASNKPRYYYGSRDSSGAYTTVGGNSSGDTVPALLKSNEMVVSGKSNVQKAQNALNGGGTGGNVNMSFPISFAVSGSVDRSTADYMIGRVESTVKSIIENNRYTNLINTAFA
jgi:hypothetical protein